ncbi:hypothetical protein [Halorussus ruber]|uniref:hypothetical protein n=1 Tax=Halorussus ruber TaxID=1126238 RepID=UPI001092AD4A|nr:hypothetical protein [Halorussus ruber]
MGADRAILYLEAPVMTLADLDGSREQDFRSEARKFLDSPAAAFDKHPDDYVGHIRELGSKTRGFATWCQSPEMNRELCVVHEIYRKENESDFWPDLEDYNAEGQTFATKFDELESDSYGEWIDSLRSRSGVEVVTNE